MLLAIAVVACGSHAESDDTESGGGEGGGAVDEPEKPDLFACELPVDCLMNIGHLGESVTPEMMKCESDLALGGKGVELELSSPGPYPTEIEVLTIVGDDEKAIVQSRSRCTSAGACEDQNTTEWRRSDVQRCDVVPIDLDDPTRCGDGEERCVYLSVTNCVAVGPEISCADVTP